MAKRKRKTTLFDVINSGQPIGLQVRQRVPTYQPAPELPVKKKLAKWFGRRPAATEDPDRPLSAAEQLEQLRRELAPPTPVEEPPPEKKQRSSRRHLEAIETRAHEPAAERSYDRSAEPEPMPSPRSRIADLAAAAAAAEAAEQEEAAPRIPRKPLGTIAREQWNKVSPKITAASSVVVGKLKVAGVRSAEGSKFVWTHARELTGRHGVTAMSAAGMILVLGGAFYAGKLLLSRPAVNLPGTELAEGAIRPDVMNLNGARANEAVANVNNTPPQAQLQRTADASQPAAVFSGRRLDLNYVIVQSYTTQAEAEAAVDVLTKYGIASTVEPNLPRWSVPGKTIFSVVSTDGFSKLRDDANYQRFLKTIGEISEKETGKTLPRRLDPLPYRYQPAQNN